MAVRIQLINSYHQCQRQEKHNTKTRLKRINPMTKQYIFAIASDIYTYLCTDKEHPARDVHTYLIVSFLLNVHDDGGHDKRDTVESHHCQHEHTCRWIGRRRVRKRECKRTREEMERERK